MTSLTAVLELEPARYATRVHAHPNASSAEDPEGWTRYGSESHRDGGIVGVTPYKPGSWFVPLSSITDAAVLRTILGAAFRDLTRWEVDELGPLPGGYVLVHGGEERARLLLGPRESRGLGGGFQQHSDPGWAISAGYDAGAGYHSPSVATLPQSSARIALSASSLMGKA
jgi:hypothetical protein